MRTTLSRSFILCFMGIVSLSWLSPYRLGAAAWDPGAADYSGRKGKTIYVSKLGDNSDGSSWQKAFRTIQAALQAVPDAKGGHRVIIRPDTYAEGLLRAAHKGAPGAYNLLIGDCDGQLGSGATGWVVIDSSCPGLALRLDPKTGGPKIVPSDLPESGFKSVDCWSPWCYPSGCWDRWVFRNLYGSGGEGGIGAAGGGEFSALWDNCVGIGRFCGGGMFELITRKDEPVLFRRCYLINLDWWGDCGGAYVRGESKTMPAWPDAIFEDCTIIGPDNALQAGWAGVDQCYTRVRFKNCRLMVLNFSQPRGTPSSGVICCGLKNGKQLHVDFEDCALMGFKVFGLLGRGGGEVSYTTRGRNTAYVQFEQPTPKGFERLGRWPLETFNRIAPPRPAPPKSTLARRPKPQMPGSVRADPSGPGYSGRKGATLYVSKLGDNSDGSSWQKAFHTIQAALLAVPDARGGHRVIVRPDTYEEANLYPTYRGAAGAYNLLVGDVDGKLGSKTIGWVVIDSGCPGLAVRMDTTQGGGNPPFKIIKSDLPESGLKCVDWWCPFRCDPHHSGSIWDRWIYRNLYVTGSEGGPGWDMTCDKGVAFSAVVEDCVGIGRFAGGAIIAHTPRKDEPVLFRRCYLINLDWWGDAGAVYVRGESKAMPDVPHAIFEECTMIGPNNALKVGWPGVADHYTRVRLKDCRLIVLNFSQPRGTPATGVVRCDLNDGKQCHVDFEDCTLMGFKALGARQGEIAYTTRGSNKAYVEFEQTVPRGFERLGLWPVETFESIAPPKVGP